MANGQKQNMGKWLAFGAVGIGAYLLWKKMTEGQAAPATYPPTVTVQPTDSLMPGTLLPAAAGIVQQQASPATLAPSGYASTGMVPPMTVPAQYAAPTAYPYAASSWPDYNMPGSPSITKEQYLAMVGNPKAGATVTGPVPPAGLFPEFKGSAGPKQKKCVKAGGTWTGPTGKKFCVMPG